MSHRSSSEIRYPYSTLTCKGAYYMNLSPLSSQWLLDRLLRAWTLLQMDTGKMEKRCFGIMQDVAGASEYLRDQKRNIHRGIRPFVGRLSWVVRLRTKILRTRISEELHYLHTVLRNLLDLAGWRGGYRSGPRYSSSPSTFLMPQNKWEESII